MLCTDGPDDAPNYKCSASSVLRQKCGRGICVAAGYEICGTQGTTICAAGYMCCGRTAETKNTDMECASGSNSCPNERRSDTSYGATPYVYDPLAISDSQKGGNAEMDAKTSAIAFGTGGAGIVLLTFFVCGLLFMRKRIISACRSCYERRKLAHGVVVIGGEDSTSGRTYSNVYSVKGRKKVGTPRRREIGTPIGIGVALANLPRSERSVSAGERPVVFAQI